MLQGLHAFWNILILIPLLEYCLFFNTALEKIIDPKHFENKWLYGAGIPNTISLFLWFFFPEWWRHVWKTPGYCWCPRKRLGAGNTDCNCQHCSVTSALAFLIRCSAYIYCINIIMIMHSQSNMCNMTIFTRPSGDVRSHCVFVWSISKILNKLDLQSIRRQNALVKK